MIIDITSKSKNVLPNCRECNQNTNVRKVIEGDYINHRCVKCNPFKVERVNEFWK